MFRACVPFAILILLTAADVAVGADATSKPLSVSRLPDKGRPGFVEIRGMAAGEFDADIWSKGTLNWVQDVRSPMMEPREGAFRNIYAPSAVQTPEGWRLFYGAWDGVPSGNDRIYSALTKDFLAFGDRHTVIEHGQFVHVCNVNALRLKDGSYSLICTAYPDKRGLNKPAFFSSKDGKTWNGTPAPYPAAMDDIISVEGYSLYNDADINGMNCIMYEDGVYRLYFSSFKDFGKVYRASGTDGKSFKFEGVALSMPSAVNDVKKFRSKDKAWYLMGLHMNTGKMWYSLSTDGLKFDDAHVLGTSFGEADPYIVAVGWVVSGEQEKSGRRVLGVLYGAGASPGLAENRLFSRWIQKRAVFVGEDGVKRAGVRALGPDRQLVEMQGADKVTGWFEIYSEDGKTLLGKSDKLTVSAGDCVQARI